jgi:50S ribosome-binding GTPase
MLHSLQSVRQGVCSFLRPTSDVHTNPHTQWPLPAVHHIDSSQSIMAAPCGSPSKDGLSPTVSQASAGAPTDSPDPAIDPQSNAKLILVLGSSGSGLSSFINRVAGNNKLAIRDPYLYSTCTTEVQGQTIEFNGRTYRMIDTPGFEGTMPDSEVLKRMSIMLEHT